MKFFDRFLLLIYSMSVMVALLIIGLAAVGWTTPASYWQSYLLDNNYRAMIGIGILVFAFISLRFIVVSVAREKIPQQAIIQTSEDGQIRVTADALQSVIQTVAGNVRGVLEVKPRVKCRPEGIAIMIKAEVWQEANIPEITNDLTERIQAYIRDYVGVPVHSIRILVDKIASQYKSSVGRKLS